MKTIVLDESKIQKAKSNDEILNHLLEMCESLFSETPKDYEEDEYLDVMYV